MIKWFSTFRTKNLDPLDFSVLKTDMHSHLIPLIDDGSQSEEESIQIISELKEFGFSKIITTPFFPYLYKLDAIRYDSNF